MPWPTQTMPFEGSISNQEPDFTMTGPRIHPSRLQQMTTGNHNAYERNNYYASSVRNDDAISNANAQSISPPDSIVTTRTHSGAQRSKHITPDSSGIFTKGLPIPLAFHVLAGPMQKVAEMTITVSPFSFHCTGLKLMGISEWEEVSWSHSIEPRMSLFPR
jgi:hypothetical protein